MIVVTGATGNVGQPLVQALAAAGEKVTALSRGISDAAVPEGVRSWQADLTAPESLRLAFNTAEALFLMFAGADMYRINAQAILEVARGGGVERVVLLSSQGVLTRPESASHGGLMRSIEEAVLQSGMDWTILRPGGFASNAYAWAESVRTRRTIAAPFPDVGLPVIDPADIAEVAAAALSQDAHAGSAYTLTGPALVTPRQQAAAISETLGEPVQFVELGREEARERMLGFMPEPVADTTLDVLGKPTPAEQRISPDVEGILGRSPSTFAHWARRHVAAFQ
jgi:uncharacterized protein YbjT (DUF2867 family)